jgi:hypothetical protein
MAAFAKRRPRRDARRGDGEVPRGLDNGQRRGDGGAPEVEGAANVRKRFRNSSKPYVGSKLGAATEYVAMCQLET